jgi:glycosyltransferase involved in cell wall biosynthesis
MLASILIDATHFGTAEPTGVERYTDALLPGLSTELLTKGVEVFWTGHTDGAPAGMPEGVRWLHSPYRRGWTQRGVRALMDSGLFELYFTPSGIVPVGGRFRRMMTVHDLAFIHFPDSYSWKQRLRLVLWQKRAVSGAERIIVPTQVVARDAEQTWGYPLEQVAIIPHGSFPLPNATQPVDGISSDSAFVLYMGRIEEKKNIKVLLRSFRLLGELDAKLHLVLAGKRDPNFDLEHQLKALPERIRKRVHVPGYVSPAEQRWLYDHCAVVAVPSPGEGFGFPVLEGFAAQKPVVVANGGAAPEVGGDAVLAVEPFDTKAWYEGLRHALTDAEISHNLVTTGRKRLKEFSWEKSCRETATVLLA